MGANLRRADLKSDLDRLISRVTSDKGESIETLHSAIWGAAIILKEIYVECQVPRLEPRCYLNLVHAAELLSAFEYWIRGLSIKDSIGLALRWRWDRKVPMPEIGIFRKGDFD